MRSKLNILRFTGAIAVIAMLFIFLAPDIADARGSRSGGGRSFGGSRKSFSSPRKSFSTPSRPSTPQSMNRGTPSKPKSSFGGTRLNSSRDYTAKYGTPRKSTPANQLGSEYAGKVPNNYVIHSYGGYGSGLMTGYMMGSTSWMWMMPFHPAFYYSKPYYVNNPDGTVGVYPPTFSFEKLIFTLIIVGAIIYIVVRIIRRRRSSSGYVESQSSFS